MSESATNDPNGARAHARAQGGVSIETMPVFPPSAADHWPEGVEPESAVWAETVGAGNYTALAVAAGTVIELTDLEGDACAHLALFNSLQTDERLNVADTVKVQWQAYLAAGHLLLSDRGRVLATILADTSEHHDTFAGTSTRRVNEARYGSGSAHGGSPAGLELLTLAAAKFGLEPRDLPPTVTLFQGVFVEPTGALTFTGSAGAGATVRLRAELPLIVLLANVPHPLDPRPEYTSSPLRIRAWAGSPATGADSDTPEAARAYANTIAYSNLRGI
ncbi:urea carboxylase-associated protein 2 [Conyzicola lurida]|uniref:Urea carboxylase-associated protein 2 n=1 Tax=Conyzicola lurida TaxID=1172621 RepID=A0A841AHB1_9MICO|nr:urea amidolyase associated protein UAAP1 [Conyzicola lurida]MBB5841738.1 urea carboxylase-associated protein 2 [Conyzicola lurida]